MKYSAPTKDDIDQRLEKIKNKIDKLVDQYQKSKEQNNYVQNKPMLTAGILKVIFPANNQIEQWVAPLDNIRKKYNLEGDRLAMFLAQIGHESRDLTRLEENLNYSAKRLMQVWPKRFPTLEIANKFARNPEALANEVYGGRMGNDQPGDGWKYRGRGPIQLTGKSNYAALEKDTGLNVLKDPDLLVRDYEASLESAAWFFTKNTSGADIRQVTRQINGGYHGLKDREHRYTVAKNIIGKLKNDNSMAS